MILAHDKSSLANLTSVENIAKFPRAVVINQLWQNNKHVLKNKFRVEKPILKNINNRMRRMLASKATCSLNSNALLQLEILQSRNESAYAFFYRKLS